MKKNLLVALTVAFVAASAFAAGGGVVTGAPPSQQSYAGVQVIIPSVLGVDVESDLVYDLSGLAAQTFPACPSANVYPFAPGCGGSVFFTPTSGGTAAKEAQISLFSSDNNAHSVKATLTDSTGAAAWDSAGAPGNFYVSDGVGDAFAPKIGTGVRTALNSAAVAAITLGAPGTNTFPWTRADQLIEYGLSTTASVVAGTYNGRVIITLSR